MSNNKRSAAHKKSTAVTNANAVSDWVTEMKLALIRLEAAALYARLVDGLDPEKEVAARLATTREVWERCPLSVGEEDGDPVLPLRFES